VSGTVRYERDAEPNAYLYYTFMTTTLCSSLQPSFNGLNEIAVFVQYLHTHTYTHME